MTDLEIVKACAEAMGYEVVRVISNGNGCYPVCFTGNKEIGYDPLHDKAQAMDLVIKLRPEITPYDELWNVGGGEGSGAAAQHTDLLRAICECVAAIKK